jgi:hypothetical protein
MDLLGDIGHVESRFNPFGGTVRVSARWVHGLRQVVTCFFYLEIVLILTQDRCTVCAVRNIGSEIILDAPDGSPM